MGSPQYVGDSQPNQLVMIRLGHFSRYAEDNPSFPLDEANGAGHQPWAGPPTLAHVGLHGKNPFYDKPWQAKWFPTTDYVVIPNIMEVKLDKKLEGLIGGIGTATIQVENILYTAQAGGYHTRERGAMSPLRGDPYMPLKDEIEAAVAANEWHGRFAYAAQVVIFQGYGTARPKTFTGLIEDIDSTSRPDRITLTARDFGQVFTDTHFIGWGKDPIISTPVVFIDAEDASERFEVGYNANSSNENPPHVAANVLDFDKVKGKPVTTWWETNAVHDPEQTEYVEIALPEGVYHKSTYRLHVPGMEVYISLKPTPLTHGLAPTRTLVGKKADDMTIANKLLDAGGWVDIFDGTKPESQVINGEVGGKPYSHKYMRAAGPVGTGDQEVPLSQFEGEDVKYRVGANSILRLSFKKLHKEDAGEDYKAAVEEFHGVREQTEEGAGKDEWVIVEDIADVIRVLCQWAGFKEWDIPDTGARLPQRLLAYQDKSYMDIIKQVCEGIGFTFFMADPVQDPADGGPARGEESLGVPTFRKARMLANDSLTEQAERESGIEPVPSGEGTIKLPNRGSTRPGLPNPVITDRTLLQNIQLKQTNEPLSAIIRVWGVSGTRPGDAAAGITSGQQVFYTLRPPWTGVRADRYATGRLGGVLKTIVHHDPLFSSVALCRAAALSIALWQAIESAEATIEFPALPNLDLDDHAQVMDLGTGISTRVAVLSRSSTFVDGEKRKFTMTVTGVLLDTPDVRQMVNIIKGLEAANGQGNFWAEGFDDTGEGNPSVLGYG